MLCRWGGTQVDVLLLTSVQKEAERHFINHGK